MHKQISGIGVTVILLPRSGGGGWGWGVGGSGGWGGHIEVRTSLFMSLWPTRTFDVTTHAYTHIHMVHMHTHTHAHTHTCTYTWYMYACTLHIFTHTRIHAHAHTHTFMHTHTQTHSCTHARTHAHILHTDDPDQVCWEAEILGYLKKNCLCIIAYLFDWYLFTDERNLILSLFICVCWNSVPTFLHTGPPVLLNPERVIPYSESQRLVAQPAAGRSLWLHSVLLLIVQCTGPTAH